MTPFEIDCKVAEAMGYHPAVAPRQRLIWKNEANEALCLAEHDKAFTPSRRIEHAMEALEHFKAFNPFFGYNDEIHAWWCSFDKKPGGCADADTPAMAICLAIIQAFGKDGL